MKLMAFHLTLLFKKSLLPFLAFVANRFHCKSLLLISLFTSNKHWCGGTTPGPAGHWRWGCQRVLTLRPPLAMGTSAQGTSWGSAGPGDRMNGAAAIGANTSFATSPRPARHFGCFGVPVVDSPGREICVTHPDSCSPRASDGSHFFQSSRPALARWEGCGETPSSRYILPWPPALCLHWPGMARDKGTGVSIDPKGSSSPINARCNYNYDPVLPSAPS